MARLATPTGGAYSVSWVLGLLGAVFLGMLAREAWGWLPRLSHMIIWLETAPLPKERRLVRREEWYGELAAEYDERRLSGLLWTLKLCPVSLWEVARSTVASENAKKGIESDNTLRVAVQDAAIVIDSARAVARSAADVSITTDGAKRGS